MPDTPQTLRPPALAQEERAAGARRAAPVTLSRALLELLRSEGVDRLFGNPGTTELPLMAELGRSTATDFVLGLQEATVVAMADGYARATRRPSAVLLHIVAGVANGLIGLHNARTSRTPLVAIAGQQDQRHLDQAPMLSGDVVGIARAVCKEAVEVHQPYDLLPVARRAFQTAQAPPSGPVLVSVPMDLLDQTLDEEPPERSPIRQAGASEGSAEAAGLLVQADRPAIVAGNSVAHEGALEELVRVAERLQATTYHQPLFDAISFPLDHPLYAGMLPTSNVGIAELLTRHDVVFVVGAHAFPAHHYTVRSAVPRGVRLVQLASDRGQVARNYPVELGLVGSIRATLSQIAAELEALGGRSGGAERPAGPSAPSADARPGGASRPPGADAVRAPDVAARELAEALPADAIVVEEAITTGIEFRRHLRLRGSDQYHHTIGGGLGWGIGAAVGVKLAQPSRPVVAVLGDGSALYSIQGLWTAARYRVGAVFVVLNNREYRAVKQGLPHERDPAARRRDVGVDIADPPVDFGALARGFGVRAETVAPETSVGEALALALERGTPSLLEVPIQGMADR